MNGEKSMAIWEILFKWVKKYSKSISPSLAVFSAYTIVCYLVAPMATANLVNEADFKVTRMALVSPLEFTHLFSFKIAKIQISNSWVHAPPTLFVFFVFLLNTSSTDCDNVDFILAFFM